MGLSTAHNSKHGEVNDVVRAVRWNSAVGPWYLFFSCALSQL